mgnify:CR=1 FL=1
MGGAEKKRSTARPPWVDFATVRSNIEIWLQELELQEVPGLQDMEDWLNHWHGTVDKMHMRMNCNRPLR